MRARYTPGDKMTVELKKLDRANPRWRFVWALLAILFFLAVDAFDSFKIPSNADERGGALTARVLAPFYGAGHASAQDQISVVLITDDTLRWAKASPPPPYQMQEDLLRILSAFGPKAIFFDFTYTHARETPEAIASFADAVATANAEGVPVFLGPVEREAEGLKPLQEVAQVDLLTRAKQPSHYPSRGSAERPTPAFSLYQASCVQAGPGCDLELAQSLQAASKAAPTIALQWRTTSPDALNQYWRAEELAGCENEADGMRARLSAMGSLVVREAFRGALVSADQRVSACFPHLTAPARAILEGQGDLEAFARGRVIMIGAGYFGSADETNAPGLGRIPGVFQHAMALDNLMTFGDHYRRPPPEVALELGLDDLFEALISAALIALGFLALDRFTRALAGVSARFRMANGPVVGVSAEEWRSKVVAPTTLLFAFLAILVSAPFLAGIAASAVMNWPAANSIGVVLAVFGVGALFMRGDVARALGEADILWRVASGAAIVVLGLGATALGLVVSGMDAGGAGPSLMGAAGAIVSVLAGALMVMLLGPPKAARVG